MRTLGRHCPSVVASFAVSLSMIVAGCGGGGDGTTNPAPTVASVSVSVTSPTITVGATASATAVARDAGGSVVAGKSVAWSSSSAAVATVDANGLITVVAGGTTNIIATIDGKTGDAALTVTPPPVASVAVTLAAASITANQTTSATAVLRDAQGNALSARSVVWSTSNNAVATVTSAGLVTGVSAGSADIVATSEGRSGQASLTVKPTVSVDALVLETASGQSLDSNNVAGEIKLSFDQQLPAGFRGVIEVKIAGVTFLRDSVFGATTSSLRSIIASRTVQTATAVSVITANELRSTPMVLNGTHELLVSLAGNVPGVGTVTSSARQNIRLNNADAVRLYGRPARQTQISGRNVLSGDIDMFVEDISFSGVPIDRIEIVRAPAQTTYGAAAIGGVIDVITRSGTGVRQGFTVAQSSLAFESNSVGNRFVIRSYQRGSSTYSLGDIPQAGGNASSVDGSLLAVSYSGPLPTGVRFQSVPAITPGVLPSGFTPLGASPVYIDNLINAPAGVFSPLSGNTQVGAPLYASGTLPGTFANRFARTHDFRADVTYSAFNDPSGIDPAKTVFRYGSLSQPKLNWNTWSLATALPLTNNNYDLSADATFEDFAGNRVTVDLATNALNDIGFGGIPTSFNQRAAFSVTDATATATFGGTGTVHKNNWPTVGTAGRTVTISGATPGLRSPFGAWTVTYNDQPLYGIPNGAALLPELYFTTGTGTSGDASFAFGTWTARALSRYQSDQGLYKATLDIRLNNGQSPTTAIPNVYFVNDRDRPTLTGLQVGGVLSARGTYSGSVDVTDPIGLGSLYYGARSTNLDSRFDGGKFFVELDRLKIGNGPQGTRVLQATPTFTGTMPGSITIADNTGSFTNAVPFGVDGLVGKVSDLADNLSFHTFTSFPAFTPVRLTTPPTSFQQLMSGGAACTGTSALCGAIPRTVNLDAGLFYNSPSLFVPKIAVYGVHTTSKRVYCFGESSSTQITPVGSGLYRTFYFVDFDAKRFDGEAGNYMLFSVALSANQDVMVSNFRPFTVIRGQE